MSKQHLLEVHVAVLLFGLAGLFGKWIDQSSVLIVWGRVLFASLSLYIFISWKGMGFRLAERADYWRLAALGALLALHWITFFQAIQVSTVAIGLLTFSTFPMFSALLEPLFTKERLQWRNIFPAMIALGGVALVTPGFSLANEYVQGALWGCASGATFAVLSILNRRYVQRYSSLLIAFYQDATAALVLLPALFWLIPLEISAVEIGLLALLGIVFTALSHTFFINGLRTVPARTASVIASLEPVYGITAAALLLGEWPEMRILAGGAIILLVAAYVSFREGPGKKNN